MKRNIFLSITLILLLLLSSCGVTPMEEGRSVNEYIFPYTEFTLSEDGTYYSASIVEDAAISEIYIPSSIDYFGDDIPVKYFTGFESDKDLVNLEKTVFDSSLTEIKLDSLNQASILSTITFNTVEEGYTVWTNLPVFEQTEESEFQGWYLTRSGARVYNGDVMVPGYTQVEAKWGTHIFSDTYLGKDPTCTENGWTPYHYCTNPGCGYTSKVEIPALGHSLIKHEKSSPTCIAYGYTRDSWECTRCKCYFEDSEGKEKIENTADLILAYSGHVSDGKKYYDETSHWLKCSICGEVYDKTAHTYGPWHIDEEKGSQNRECTFCHYVEESSEDHVWEYVNAVESTCTEMGHDAYYKCKTHGDEYSLSNNPVVIIDESTLHEKTDRPLKDHTLTEWQDNGEEHWKECTECGGIFDEGDHNFEYTFTPDTSGAVVVKRECTLCHATGRSETGEKSAFDVSAAFGKINIVRDTSADSWTLSYYGDAESYYWADENGEKVGEESRELVINSAIRGKAQFKVFCYALDRRGSLTISFALLTSN